jgi:hypothetical protein
MSISPLGVLATPISSRVLRSPSLTLPSVLRDTRSMLEERLESSTAFNCVASSSFFCSDALLSRYCVATERLPLLTACRKPMTVP